MFKVIESIDYLDPNPEVLHFDERWEADDFVLERVLARIEFDVTHSPYSISAKEYSDMLEYEMTFFHVEEVEK